MADVIENPTCYASQRQRHLLKAVAGAPLFRGFFLSGGTCLAVFYLHHRVSRDLDFFTVDDLDLSEMAGAARAFLRPDAVVAAAPHFLSCVVGDIKVDFVVDPLSDPGPRPSVAVDGVPVPVDRLDNIGPNKICALVSRGLPRDAVDVYALYRDSVERFLRDYAAARRREALLDDLLYAGEKLHLLAEEAPRLLAEMGPDLRKPVSPEELAAFLAGLGERLFRMGTEEVSPPPR